MVYCIVLRSLLVTYMCIWHHIIIFCLLEYSSFHFISLFDLHSRSSSVKLFTNFTSQFPQFPAIQHIFSGFNISILSLFTCSKIVTHANAQKLLFWVEKLQTGQKGKINPLRNKIGIIVIYS